MTFDEWFHKEYEPADLQIKQYAENKESLHIPATVYLEDLKKAFEAGQEGKVVERFEAYGQCRDSRRIAELEKENAELKDYRLTTLAKQQTDMSKYALNLEHKLSWYDDQLTKAKEIIREFVEWATWQGSNCPNFKSIQDKAEQFLKDSEVEK